MKSWKNRKGLGLGCKGNIVIDGAMFLIVVFVFVLISFFGYKAISDMSADITADLTHNESTDTFDEVESRYPDVFTGLIILVILGFWIFMIVTAMLSDTHPVLFIMFMILLIFLIIASMFLGNFYEEFFDDDEYAGVTAQFSLVNFIMSNFMKLSIAVFFSCIIIAFAKGRG